MYACAEHNKGHGNQFDQWAIVGVHANAGLGDDAAMRAATQASMAAHIDEPEPEPAAPEPTGAHVNAGMSEEAALQAAMTASMAKKTSQPQTAQVNSSFTACNALAPPLSSSLRLCCLITTRFTYAFLSKNCFHPFSQHLSLSYYFVPLVHSCLDV